MEDHTLSTEDEIKNASMVRPHVVILGAGASLAAFEHGDKYGKILPLMNNLVEVVGLDSTLKKHKIPYTNGENFETIYSRIHQGNNYRDALCEIEDRIEYYFSNLVLTDEPTVYDYLVLSLRKKDLIATFNWDPFLYNTCFRNHQKADLPHVVYLHGNVAIGYCLNDKKCGCRGSICSVCEKTLSPSRLLYPIEQKNYTNDPFISLEWQALQSYLKKAYIVTVFGYNAPQSDIKAVELMQQAWGKWEERSLEQIEIIDIKEEDDIVKTWDSFIHTHHYDVHKNFFDSWIAKHPRRTCEAMWSQNMDVKFIDENPVPKGVDLNSLWEWYQPLIGVEKTNIKTAGSIL